MLNIQTINFSINIYETVFQQNALLIQLPVTKVNVGYQKFTFKILLFKLYYEVKRTNNIDIFNAI